MRMKHNTLTLNVLQLSNSGLSMHKLVALTITLEDTQSRIKAPGETQRTISNDAFANVEVLQSCHYQNRGGVNLLIKKMLSFCGIRDLKMNEVDGFWSMIHLECFLLLVASIDITPQCETQMMIFLKTLKKTQIPVTPTKMRDSWFWLILMPAIQRTELLRHIKKTITKSAEKYCSINSEIIFSEPRCAHNLVSEW